MRKIVLLSLIGLGSLIHAQLPTASLSAYYPFNGNTNDYAGTRNGASVGIEQYGVDRWGRADSCYDVIDNSNYIMLPSDYWIYGDYSVSAWVKVKQTTSYPRLYDFGNGYCLNNALGKLSHAGNGSPSMEYYSSSATNGSYYLSSTVLTENVWYHLVYISSGMQLNIYINNVLIGSYASSYVPENIYRNSNKIGGSNAPLDDETKAYIDDFRLYDRAISPIEVGQLYNEPQYLTGIDELSQNLFQLNIYPNPSSNQLFVNVVSDKSQKIKTTVVDNLGKLLMTEESELLIGQNRFNLNVKDLASGFYHLTVSAGGKSQNIKFIKE